VRFGRIKNYAVNSFDAAATLIDAIRSASSDGFPTRDKVANALWRTHRRGIAYEHPIQWAVNGDNLAAATALHRIEGGRYLQVSVVDRSQAPIR
jgi:branched-chain amino acid transport system substrate-binding protein